jgi:NAD(P)-dependent dehydrogenase (short-subunit alcohol dehydrogenase family)
MSSSKLKNILITGGSSGIGFSTARKFIDNGYRVYITGRNTDKLTKAKEVLGDNCEYFSSDVSKESSFEELVQYIKKKDILLDCLFVNAGIAFGNKVEETTFKEFNEIFDINVKGVFFTTKTMLPFLKNHSSIILNASIVTNKGMNNLSLYSASKAAVRSFGRCLASDLKNRSIRVNTISPGITETPILELGLKMKKEDISNLEESLRVSSPAGRMGKPEEIASAVYFLASNESSFINGIELSVDGGFSQI